MPPDDRVHLFGRCTLDLTRGTLLAGDDPVHLRPQAYELLRHLAANRGRLIAKDELIQRIWQGRAVGDDSLVQCLRDVRHALGAEGAAYIRTVRGRGYIFEPPSDTAVAPSPEHSAGTATTSPDAMSAAVAGSGYPFGRRAAALLATAILLAAVVAAYRLADDPAAATPISTSAELASGYSPDADADLLYLRGRHQQQQITEQGMRSAIDLFSRAIAANPNHAPAHAGLANSYRALAIVGSSPSREAFPLAKAAAQRALQLDDRLVEAHVALGWVLSFHDWQWTEAEASLKRAIELDPRSAEAHRAYAHVLSNLGRHDEAIFEAARARELDPRALLTRTLEAQFLFYAGRYDEAERRLRDTLEMEPDFWAAHLGLGRIQILRERLPEALEPLRRATTLSGEAVEPTTQLAYALARAGREADARALMRELEDRADRTYVPAYTFAMIENGLRNRDAALAHLERSVEAREVQATFIRIDSRWNWVRADPRFAALLERLRLK